jgi:hypothetical protein
MVNLTTYYWYLFDHNSDQVSLKNISDTEYEEAKLQLTDVCSLEEFMSSCNSSKEVSIDVKFVIVQRKY